MHTTSKTIEVVVNSNGQSSVETKGFAGAECLNASRFLEAALGTPASDRRTAEFYSTAVSTGVRASSCSSGRKETM